MTNPPMDAAVRERALDVSGSFIVQAPAGSGKTELLIRRFLNLLGHVAAPEEIVAVTFTKKAAAEMRERVLTALADAEGAEPEDESERALWTLARRAWLNDRERGWRLRQHPARLRIQTIDALCVYLTRQMPWLSGFGAPVQVVEDALELYRSAALATVNLLGSNNPAWSGAVGVLLTHLDNQMPRAVALLTEMLGRRDQWLRHLGGGDAVEDEARRVLETAWRDVVESVLATTTPMLPEETVKELADCARYAARQLTATGKDHPVTVWLDRQGMPGPVAEDAALWKGLCHLLLTKSDGWRKRVNKSNGFPAGKPGRAMKTRMQAVLESLSNDEELCAALLRVRDLPAPGFDDAQWTVLAALTVVLPLAAAQLQVVFAERGRVDFSEINLRANHALGELEAPSDLALRLDSRISHLLVDEFQDTSLTQFKLLGLLTAGWMPDDGRTLFLVGDPMQSIYRFREAEVSLFLRVQREGLGMLRPVSLTLSVNFRSDTALVDWVNETFGRVFPPRSDIDRGAVSYSPSRAFIPPLEGAAVQVHGFVDPLDNSETRRIVHIIRETRERNPTERIAILVRSRGGLTDLLPALDGAGIPYSGLDIEGLDWQPVVQDLVSLTRALLFPADRMAWLSVLRAPWCGLTLRDLHALAASDRHATIGRCIARALADSDGALSDDGRGRLRRVWEILDQALAQRGRLDPRSWVENAWIAIGGPACISDHERGNARIYFELLEDYQRHLPLEDFSGFHRIVSERWSQPENAGDEGLQVMTLHKAKGLEFDTVIIPGLHRRPRTEEPRLLLWEEQTTGNADRLLLAPLSGAGAGRDPHYAFLRGLHRDKEAFETLRLLYVGCTRARRCLHLLGAVESDADGNPRPPPVHSLLSKLWPAVRDEFKFTGEPQLDLFERMPPAELLLTRLPSDWRPAELPESVGAAAPRLMGEFEESIEFSWVGETARHVGVVVHEALEIIAREGLSRWDPDRIHRLEAHWRREYARLGIPEAERAGAVARTRQALVNLLEDSRGRWLFDPKHREPRHEWDLSVNRGGAVHRLRIDRTFVAAGDIRWIVDFKTSLHEGGDLDRFLDNEQQRYRAQLEHYAAAVAELDPRPIRLGLYFPLLSGWREWPLEGR